MAVSAGKGLSAYESFQAAIRQGQRFPVVLMRGSEEYLLRHSLTDYLQRMLEPSAEGFDFNEFRSAEVSGETLWNALTTLPLMAKQRVVVLELTGEPKREVSDVLIRYFRQPSPTTAFVIVAVEGGAGRFADLPAGVTELVFPPLKEADRGSWASAYAQQRGVTLDRDAVQYLVESSSSSLADIASKLDHAILYIGSAKEVSTQVLMKVSGVSSEYTVFNLEDAILERNTFQSHRIAQSLLQGGEVLLRLFSLHRGMVLKLWQISAVLRKPEEWHRSEDGVRFWNEVLRKQIFKKSIYLRAAKAMGVRRIRQAVVGLLELEIAAKTGSQEPFRYYEWIWNITCNSVNSVEPVFQPKS